MSTQNNILELFEKNRGKFLSGEDIASSLGVSRNAVWKNVSELRSKGYKIDAVNKKGYLFSEDNDIISAAGIKPFLNSTEINIDVYDELTSTNTAAKEAAIKGAGHSSVIIADSQTMGRGRHGRSFFSPKGAGLYMSLIINPDYLKFSIPTVITAYAAVMTSLAIEKSTGITPLIKWVNDIYLNGKKIVGISTEAITDYESGGVQFIVIGIGVNVSTKDSDFPKELCATSLYPDGNPLIARNHLAVEIINLIYGSFNLEQEEIMEEYKKRLFILQKEIIVHVGNESYPAIALDIDYEGHLIVQKRTGEKAVLSHGEVSLSII